MHNELVIYLIFSFIIFFLGTKISYKLRLIDFPNKRKVHLKPTAYTGGILITLIYIFGIHLFDVEIKNLNLIVSIGFLISFVGLIDDRYNLNIGGKLSLQIIPIFYLIVVERIVLTQIGSYNFFSLNLGTFAIPFTLLCVLFLINSFNYFDGIDGTLGFTSISILFILYCLIDDHNNRLFLINLLIPLIIFLFFNFSILKLPKLFLGDSGSLLYGFIISFYLIILASENIVHPILLAWCISIFVYEFLAINIIRLKKKKDPFKAGKDHLHHLLIKKTKSIFFTNFYIIILNCTFFIIGLLSFNYASSLVSLILFIICFFIFLFFRERVFNRK